MSLVTMPMDTSFVAAASNRHSISFPHWASANSLTLLLYHVISSTNMGVKSDFAKVSTLSF